MLEDKYLTEANPKPNLRSPFESFVQDIFLYKTKTSDPKKAKTDTMELVKKEAEKVINAALKKALRM